jgi:hypothetical protein
MVQAQAPRNGLPERHKLESSYLTRTPAAASDTDPIPRAKLPEGLTDAASLPRSCALRPAAALWNAWFAALFPFRIAALDH